MPGARGAERAVDLDPAARVEGDAGRLEAEPFGVGPPPDRDEHDVGFEGLGSAAGGGLDRNLQRRTRGVDGGDLAGESEGEALAGEQPLRLLRHLAVEAGKDPVEEFDDRHGTAEAAPDRAKLEADDAGTDHQQALRDRRQAIVRRST